MDVYIIPRIAWFVKRENEKFLKFNSGDRFTVGVRIEKDRGGLLKYRSRKGMEVSLW